MDERDTIFSRNNLPVVSLDAGYWICPLSLVSDYSPSCHLPTRQSSERAPRSRRLSEKNDTTLSRYGRCTLMRQTHAAVRKVIGNTTALSLSSKMQAELSKFGLDIMIRSECVDCTKISQEAQLPQR